MRAIILQGDALSVLKTMADESADMCVTSPPYFGLRDYGVDGQIGLERSPQDYIDKLVDIFHEVKRVLKKDGTLWVVIADSYAGSGKGAANYPDNAQKYKQGTSKGMLGASATTKVKTPGIKPKDLIGIPWMLAFALRADGWYLRQDIIWQKSNPMPESVRDRCTKSHEYIFLLSKSPKYYFDHEAMQEEATGYDGRNATELKGSKKFEDGSYYPSKSGVNSMASKSHERWKFKNLQDKGQTTHTFHERRAMGLPDEKYPVRNRRDVWKIALKPYKGAHFATFPEKLAEPCILAGSKENGTVLDCFSGAGTTGVVCARLNRKYIGIELNPEYVELSEKRIKEAEDKAVKSKEQISLWQEGQA